MVISISPDATVEEAAKLLHDRKIKGLPVIEDGELVGLITINEVLEFFAELFEKREKATALELKLNGEADNLATALEIITSHRANIVRAVTAPLEKGGYSREIILLIEGEDVDGAKRDLMSSNLLLEAA
jgi:CBS domain-containing protein